MQDFTVRGFGIRVGEGYCVVIERKSGVRGWVEDAQRYSLPLPAGFDTVEGIPQDRVAIAVRAYEYEHPGDTKLRERLTGVPKGE